MRSKVNFLVALFAIVFQIGCSLPLKKIEGTISSIELPSPETRREMVLSLAREIERLDGDGLLPRSQRHENWKTTVGRLSEEAMGAKDLFELGRVLRRLDATYTNLHARIYLHKEMDIFEAKGFVILPFDFVPESLKEARNSDRIFKIRNPTVSSNRGFFPSDNVEYPRSPLPILRDDHDAPQPGDVLVAINGRSMKEWSNENFLFCKYPLQSQCDLVLYRNFREEILSWDRSQPLTFKLQRKGKTWNYRLPVMILAMLTIVSGITASASPNNKNLELLNDQNGSPRLGVQFAVGADKFVSITFSVLGSQLVGNTQDTVAPSQWAIVDKNSGEELTSWADTNLGGGYITPDSTQALSLSVSNPREVMKIVSALKAVQVAISLKEAQIVYLDLQELCKTHPEKFLNLDTFAVGCE